MARSTGGRPLGLLPVNRAVDDLEVGRLFRLIDVHRRAQLGPIDRTVDRQRAFALWKWPGRPGGRPLGHLPVYGRPTGRPLADRPGGRLTAASAADLASNGHILGAYNLGLP